MSRPLLIIDMGRDAVRCSALTDGRGEASVFFEAPLNGDPRAALATLIKEMEEAGWRAFSRVFLGVPAEALSLRVVEVPIGERQKVEEVLPFELSESLVKGTEDFIFEAVTLARGRTMAVALEKSELRQYLDMLRDMGLEPFRVGSALLCKDKLLARLNTAGVPAAFLDNESIIISDGSKPLLYKKITGEIDVKLALADIETEGTEINTFYYCGARAMELVPAGREAIAAQGFEERFTGVRALAEEAREGWRDAVNFRKGEFADTEAFEKARKGFKVTAALMLLVAILWGGLIFLKSSRLSGEARHLKSQILLSYQRVFPGDRTIQDPLYQLEIKLKEQAKDMGLMGRGIGVLDNLNLLAKAGGSAGISLYQLSMRGMRVTAKGKAASFEKAEKFKAELIKLKTIHSLVLTDVKKSVSGGVTFSIALDINSKGVS